VVTVLMVAAVAAFSVQAVSSFRTLMRLRINGPVYARIMDGKDLLAGAAPPPGYIVESYLTAHQLADAEDPETVRALIESFAKLRAAYGSEVEQWGARLEPSTIRDTMLVRVHEPAERFFEMAEATLVPLCHAGDRDAARVFLNGPMQSEFRRHREAIDDVVALARRHSAAMESEAEGEISSGRRAAVLLAGAGAVTVLCVLGALLVWSQARSGARAEAMARGMMADLAEVKGTLDRSPDAVYMFDSASLGCVYANRAGLDQARCGEGDVSRLTPRRILPEVTDEAIDLMVRPLLDGSQSSASFESTLCGPDGRQTDVEVTLQLVRLSGDIARLVLQVRDVSERHRSERFRMGQARVLELIASDAAPKVTLEELCRVIEGQRPGMLASVMLLEGDRLRATAGPSLDPVYLRLIDGLQIGPEVGSCGSAAATGERVIVVNTLTDPKWAAFVDVARRFRLMACWSQPVKSVDGEVLGAFAIYHRKPTAPSPEQLRLIEEAARLAAIAIERQRSGERIDRMIAELRRARAEAEARAEEMAALRDAADSANVAKSQFLANMSHEIRTPLTAIIGFAEVLASGPEGDQGSALRATDTIRRAASHLLSVVNDVLDLSKIESGRMTTEPVPTDLPRVVREVANLLRPKATEKGIGLRVMAGSILPGHVRIDPVRLRQILMNLAGNAVKFTDRGAVTIIVSEEGGGGEPWLVFDITDTGDGVSEEQASAIFQPFQQADASVTRRRGGTGLGLAISRKLARLMGGDVTLVRSVRGEGSCFRLRLPLVPEDGSACVNSLESVIDGDGVAPPLPWFTLTGRVLLVEDGADNRRLIAHHLARAGAEVEVACDGEQALGMVHRAAHEGRAFGLVLTDMQMPVMDGYALARTLRSDGSDVAIVALTAHAMAEDRKRCLDAGCDDYASKPIERAALLAKCAEWLNVPSRRAARRAA